MIVASSEMDPVKHELKKQMGEVSKLAGKYIQYIIFLASNL